MSKIMIGVPYLEYTDIDPSTGSLKIKTGKPTIVMVYASWCPHCKHAMPDFEKFAKMTGMGAAVQIDGGTSDQQAGQFLAKVNPSPGVPAFLGFDKNGKFVNIHNGGRDLKAFQKFAGML